MRANRFAALAVPLLAGCNFAPHYQPPATPDPPAAYHETGPWTKAAPADAAARGAWWQVFNDPTLNGLEERIEKDSPQLAAALGRYEQAQGFAERAGAAQYPQIQANASAERGRTPQNGQQHAAIAGASLAYELDLWGRVRNLAAAGRADEQASAGDLAAMRLSLQAELADDYLQMRGLDGQVIVLGESVDAYTQALQLTNARYDGGAASALDVGRARTQLATAQAQLAEAGASRALLEHAIAALLGETASAFTLASADVLDTPPVVPVTAPAALLQRRPDIAAAERRVAAANARVGVARAAFYPDISLNASGDLESVTGSVVKNPGLFWALGPAAATMTLFDGGALNGQLKTAHGVFDEAAANYRTTVLGAFREVEDQMALANRLATAEEQQEEAVAAAAETDQLATTRYREGAASYLEVVTAQTAELDARRAAVDLRSRRLTASVDLIRAMGGGWEAAATQDH